MAMSELVFINICRWHKNKSHSCSHRSTSITLSKELYMSCDLRIVWPCVFLMKKFEMPTWCNNVIYWSFFSSTCFGRIRPTSGALDVKLQHMVSPFCRWVMVLRAAATLRTITHLQNGKTIFSNLTSSTPDVGRMRPKHVELKKLQ